MKSLLATLTIFLFCNMSLDYSTILLPKLITHSDLIAQIKIIKLNGNHFDALVIKNIKSEATSDTIKVKYFEDWFCAQRWASYKIGQEEIIFLNQEDDNTWKILGFGNEGEMPIMNDEVYLKSPFLTGNKYFGNTQKFKLKDGYIFGTKYDLKTVIEGINTYLKTQKKLDRMIDDESVIDFYPKNSFLKKIIDELILLNRRKFDAELFEKRFLEK